ncbi:uncharacterized protein AMSG_05006 [Thecamonas trahens ATCC 50062]|uniref:EF-hand domain-containing protein n=1 Tax=Thecamonas trahens ATCC 50062 TaxID=461836 RepID=A0A0L0DAD5_THETB|nr:hypothetical protein AMSG_05006 [Thecamonas trahens ATCC 50062]KNC49046.1 hypothetical protein AMSG_05006 [Thecamonas trahens ATCC 50062]|eukprot:XP_013758081.1 hypothetical protein AMSG_05006 [Thecamonas trahens ATCC 50062]
MNRLRSAAGKTYKGVDSVVSAGANEVVGVMQVGVDNVLDRTLDYAGKVVADSIKDPEMPKWVQRGVDDMVGEIWPDVKEESKSKVLSGVHKKVPVVEGSPPSWCPNPYRPIRAFFLYHMFPSDKTMWGSFKDPIWWFFSLLALVPVFGISQILYIIVFLVIDWGDEYQLVHFILSFKGLQFVTTGFLPALISAVQFYVCTAHTGRCDRDGPGEPLWTYGLFLGQILIVWLAFVLLPYSVKKGARSLIVRGRAMRKFDYDDDGVLSPDEARAYLRRRDTQRPRPRPRPRPPSARPRTRTRATATSRLTSTPSARRARPAAAAPGTRAAVAGSVPFSTTTWLSSSSLSSWSPSRSTLVRRR